MYNDPRLKNEYHAWLLVRSFEFHPKEITKQLGLEPTDIKVKGEYRIVGKKKPHKMLNKENLWILDSELPRNIPIEKHLEHLVNKIKPYKQNFIKIANQYSLELTCAIYYYEANPGINLDKNILKELAELNIELGLDIYCLTGTVRQLEDIKDIKYLTEQLSKVEFISKYDKDNHKEAAVIVDSLAGIEDACDRIKGLHIPDLIWEMPLDEKDYKTRFNKITEDLRQINKYIKQSKYLQSHVDESDEKE